MNWILWQLADSALPTGSFIASSGLESAYGQLKLSPDQLPEFVRLNMTSYARTNLPVMLRAYDLTQANNSSILEDVEVLDAFADASMRGNEIARNASKAQGAAFVTLMLKSFIKHEVLSKLKLKIRAEKVAGHLSTVFGVSICLLQVSRDEAALMFLFLHVRSLLSAAVRLNIIGPFVGQNLMTRLEGSTREIVERTKCLSLEDTACTSPMLDIMQASHDRLYTRLFNS